MRTILFLSATMFATTASAQSLDMSGDCPGPVDITVAGVTPGATLVFLAGSAGEGSDVIGVGGCTGTVTGLAGLRFLTRVTADGGGGAAFSPSIPDGRCDTPIQVLDTSSCTLTNVDTAAGGGVVPPEGLWVLGNYEGLIGEFDGSVQYNGAVSCPDTCAAYGFAAVGARFICNHWDGGSSEGCDPSNDGEYGTANCGWMMRDGVELTENDNSEDCAGDIATCVGSSCSEGVTWHAIQCQCR
ncbi:MAG: hypothetical protein ACI8PZ_006513 [Myxococcota bacterium]|jgi:hypothetical protein